MKRSLFLLLLPLFLLPSCAKPSVAESDDVAPMWGFNVFTHTGIIESSNGPVRFTATDSLDTVVLCDKPDCRHEPPSALNPNPSCLAQIPGLRCLLFYQGRQLFITEVERAPLNKRVYTADINGANRKMLAELENVLAINQVALYGEYLLLSYINNSALNEADLLEDLEKPQVGIYAVNLSADKAVKLPVKEGFNAEISGFCLREGAVYYEAVHSLWRYDLTTGEEAEFWREKDGLALNGFADDYAVAWSADGAMSLLPLVGGDALSVAKPENGESFGNPVALGGQIYYSRWQGSSAWYERFDPATLDAVRVNPNATTSLIVMAVFPDVVYVIGNDANDEYFYGVLSTEDFIAGEYGAVKVLVYPNRQFGK
ncbi:hypothetical protein FACS189425_08390 [Clostridia bacterium]|nr:hypothetical protein FACS189425_08390 [Clostridia bacterium]